MQVSRISAITIAPGARLPMRSMPVVEAEAGKGLIGDRYHGTKHRHVTLQSQQALDQAANELGRPIEPAGTRRNLTIDVGEVPTAPGTRIRIGPEADGVLLEVVRVAAPCRLLDDNLGAGAMVALRRRAGSVCRVLVGGTISIGDPVELVSDARE